METLFSSLGKLHYSKGETYKLIIEVDQEIARYYRALIPKWICTSPQKYPAHISLVRKEVPPNLEFWGKYEGEIVPFVYTHQVFHGKVYYWLNVFCTRAEEIRIELGLPVSSEYTLPPTGWIKCFHCTIGNIKGIDAG